MPKVQICVNLTDEALNSFEAAARREGTTLQTLLERCVNALIEDIEREREEGPDHPIVT